MIFKLQCSVRDLAALREEELEEVFALLVDADRSGRHFSILRRELCAWAAENLSLAKRERTHLIAIGEQYATRGGMLEVAGGLVSVVIGDSEVAMHGENGFVIGHRALIEGEYLSRVTSLVVEDVESDGRMYSHVLTEAKTVSRVPSIAFDPIHGGGGATGRVFEREIEKNRVVVCIVDQDRGAPTDRRSDTARVVLRIHRGRNRRSNERRRPFIGVAVTTIGREVENLIPYRVCRSMYPEYEYFDELDRILARDGEETEVGLGFWQYFDVKNGLDGKKIMEKAKAGGASEETVRWIGDRLGCGRDQIEDVFIGGFGAGAVRRFLDCPEALSGFRAFTRSGGWKSGFGDYFEGLLWFLAAPVRSRT